MTFLKRLRVLTAMLGVFATFAAIGTMLFGDMRSGKPTPPTDATRPDGGRLVEDIAVTKFSKQPVLTFQPRDGEVIFAWQIQPTLEVPAARPRDILVLVDTSASQAGRPLQHARQIISAISSSLKAEDRMSVWSISTPDATRALTKDFQPANSENIAAAAAALTEVEYGSGATDLKHAIEKSLATLAPNRTRHQVVLYLGDGESAYKPVTETERLAIGNRMDLADIYFFAVPLGIKLDPQNLHGFAAITGGAVVRLQEDLTVPNERAEFVNRFTTALNTPVLKPEKWKFGEEVGESFPTKLPPLRADKSALVMGKLAKPTANTVNATVNGFVNGKPVSLTLSQPLPASLPENFFLNTMLHQWRNAPHKDAPAMLQSDRALALASTQVKLYRNEFLAQAVWAIQMDRLDDAEKLYVAAAKVDPSDKEASTGIKLVEQLKAGRVTKADLHKTVNDKVKGAKITPTEAIRNFLQDPKAVDPPAPKEPQNPGAATDLLKEAAARRAIEEQRYKVLTDATIRRGRQYLRTDPEGAYQDLKRQRDEILNYDGIGDDARRQMVADIEAVMREVFVKGAEIKRQADAERQSIARTRQRLNEFDRIEDLQSRDKNRIDQFRQLMQQARYELAYQEAQLMVQEKVVKGLAVPPTATASYIIGQQATQLREWNELTRIRQDRFLLTMMQTEKSHIPYPDEPPVHFPPAAVWRELTGLRKETYSASNLGPNAPQSQKRLRSIIEDVEVQLKEGTNLDQIPVFELLQFLSKQYNVSFFIAEEDFKAFGQANFGELKSNIKATQLGGMKLGNFLDLYLYPLNASFIVRPDYIEIVPFEKRTREKVTRVFPVDDLVLSVPNSVDRSTFFFNQQFQNNQLNQLGTNTLGGGFQNFGGGFQNFGGFNNNGANNNPLNMNGGQGVIGAQNQIGNQGVFGIAGAQGNLGQLGGQFGIQGNRQNDAFIALIQFTVARGEWANQPNVQPMPGGGGMDEPEVDLKELNSLFYYPAAGALVVRGSHRYHSAATLKLKRKDGMAAAPNNRPGGAAVVIGPDTPPLNVNADAANKPKLSTPKIDRNAILKKVGTDPRTMWSNAIDWTVTDPGLIVAAAEFLMEFDEYTHAAEVLKGNLRKGLATDEWAHEALAIALTAAKSNPVEVERASVSGIDLEPTSAKAYIKAAKAVAGLNKHDIALAFCKRAAERNPDDPTPYANAMAYAEVATDVKSDAVLWAANGLLKRDWNTTDGIDYHKQAAERLPKLEAKLKAIGQKTDDINKAITEQQQRDLVIELLWQGNADLDLSVAEPTGSVASATHKRTTGGGVLKADILEQLNDRSEVYTAASAFSGTYKVTVKQAFGRAIGGSARIKVTKFKGTARESVDLIDVAFNKPIELKLDGGSRTTLATVSEEISPLAELRRETNGTATPGMSGLGGGFGTSGSLLSGQGFSSSGPALPLVNETFEQRVPGISSNTPDVRVSYKVNPDRTSMSIKVNPVFASKGEIAMPKVPLLPGSESR